MHEKSFVLCIIETDVVHFHTAFSMYAQATGLFHFTVTFTASSDSVPLLCAGAESAAIIHQAPRSIIDPECLAECSTFADDCMLSSPSLFFLMYVFIFSLSL